MVVSSAAATLGSAHEYVDYAAAKAGVEPVTVGLAKELAGQGGAVNAVEPDEIAPATTCDSLPGAAGARTTSRSLV